MFLLLPFAAFSLEQDETLAKKVYSHITIKDYASAVREGQIGVQTFPSSKKIRQAYIKALAKSGEEKEMLKAWQELLLSFPDESDNRELMESMAWCIIEKGYASNSPIMRAMAMLGAFLSKDGKGIAVLTKAMRDRNSFIRSLALQLASQLMDEPLKNETYRLLTNETTWSVRLEAIKAIGSMDIMEARPILMQMLSNDKIHPEEKAAAIVSLVDLSDKWERDEILRLVQSDRAGFRALACELIAHFEQKEDLDLLLPLIKDNRAEVRVKALETLGCLRVPGISGISTASLVKPLIDDTDPLVAVTAAWLLTINDPEEGQCAFEKLLKHDSRNMRLLAAAALSATGKYGLPLLLKTFQNQNDLYLRMNLALGLISQRTCTEAACDCLYQGLMKQNERWMWEEQGVFQVLAPSTVKYDELIPNCPEAKNQLVRLEVLNLLAILQYPKAQQAARSFLQNQTWGITGVASALLLTEGDEAAKDIVEELLKDPNQKVRVQAALILSLWGRGDNSVAVLQDAYQDADRDLKEKILEGIARVGHHTSIPFLLKRLHEPYQTLRIIAAAALLECLYH